MNCPLCRLQIVSWPLPEADGKEFGAACGGGHAIIGYGRTTEDARKAFVASMEMELSPDRSQYGTLEEVA